MGQRVDFVNVSTESSSPPRRGRPGRAARQRVPLLKNKYDVDFVVTPASESTDRVHYVAHILERT